MQIIKQLREILKGIDATEIDQDDGWWLTSTGAEFGAGKLKEIEALVIPLWESHGRLLEVAKCIDSAADSDDASGGEMWWAETVNRAMQNCNIKQAITAAEQLTKGDA